MEDLSSFKAKYPDLARVNIKGFCLIFNIGFMLGYLKGSQAPTISALDQRQFKTLILSDEHELKKDWDAEPDLRCEWENNFDAYRGFVELHMAKIIKVNIRKT